MIQTRIYTQRWYDRFLGYFFRTVASGFLPATWFRASLPEEKDRRAVDSLPTLEIISHCWQYSNMLAYQLSSFVNYPPTKLKAIITVFYAEEDTETKALMDYMQQHQVQNVQWNWQPLPKNVLFRRGIGRNMAAKSSKADWLWFTDCDIIFHENCLDSLADELSGRRDALLCPKQERITPMLATTDPMLEKGREPQLVDIEGDKFEYNFCGRAKGAFQIVHGDVARAVGYCDGMSHYQTPSEVWCKTYEDRAYRWLLGGEDVPIDIKGIYRIRHVEKGRYKEGSQWSKVRSKIRHAQE